MNKENIDRQRKLVKRFVNPFLRHLAYSSVGPFAVLHHVGRKSGKIFETPVLVWPVEDGFIVALTYGSQVDWLRNLQAAEQGTLRWHKQEYVFQTPVFVEEKTAWPLFPPFIKNTLRKRGVHEYVKLASLPVSVHKASWPSLGAFPQSL